MEAGVEALYEYAGEGNRIFDFRHWISNTTIPSISAFSILGCLLSMIRMRSVPRGGFGNSLGNAWVYILNLSN